MPSALKKQKLLSVEPQTVEASETMEVDSRASAPQDEGSDASDDDSGGDEGSLSDAESDDSIDTDTEIAIAQQPSKSKQTLSTS